MLILLLGVYYPLPMILFVFEPPYKLMYVVSFFGTMVSSVQGLAVSTFYVFCNAEVCDQVRTAWFTNECLLMFAVYVLIVY